MPSLLVDITGARSCKQKSEGSGERMRLPNAPRILIRHGGEREASIRLSVRDLEGIFLPHSRFDVRPFFPFFVTDFFF